MAAAAAAAAAELLGSAPTMAAAADKEHVRLERETPISAPAGSRMAGSRMAERRPRAPSGAAREAGWRRANVGGWWRSRADAVEDDPGHFFKP